MNRGNSPQASIWVDADACPGVIKDILYRAAVRVSLPLTLVANRALQIPRSPWIRMLQVPHGFDVADNHIVTVVTAGDLVITADIPLAAAVVEKGASALNPRGELYTRDNVQGLLDMRNFMDTLRSSGVETGGPSALGNAERQAFASQLDRWIGARPPTAG
ncbi:MAG: YaiI/YqxD family protein [Betaproteobacteria bacterium]|nr:YaiI/YqxD family protein [Betaproteobacteria bacterium]MDH4294505.1 YaiI/YqxD family protein [Betaproteobacteria bacterium]MDH5341630.1 YaiI/YqxD family protein [Betaproteobacteria bacterium]